jgi:hypothetical protein
MEETMHGNDMHALAATLAVTRRRVIITCDRDFLVLARRGQFHAGIVYYPYGRYPVGEVIRRLVRLWEQHAAEDILNRVEFL